MKERIIFKFAPTKFVETKSWMCAQSVAISQQRRASLGPIWVSACRRRRTFVRELVPGGQLEVTAIWL